MDNQTIEKYLKFLTKDKIEFHVNRLASEDSIEIALVSRVKITSRDLAMNKEKSIYSSIEKLRDKLLQSDVFYNERKKIEEFERLNNMEFVLEALKELDLSSIKEGKKEPEYLNIRKMLGGK